MKERTTLLIFGSLAGELNESERTEFLAWLNSSNENKEWFESISQQSIAADFFAYKKIDTTPGLKKLHQLIAKQRRRTGTLYLLAAACFVGLLVLSVFYITSGRVRKGSLVTPTDIETLAKNDFPTLILSDGTKMRLDSSKLTSFQDQSGVTIKMDSVRHLTFTQKTSIFQSGTPVLYNTIDVPYGKPWKISLTDGTTIWLNAGSAISFPITNSPGNRLLTMKGEGFFDVASISENGKKKSFTVQINGMDVNVTGTRFNIRGYWGDTAVFTTLLSGEVAIIKNNQQAVLKPGEAAILNVKSDSFKVERVDTASIHNWIEGEFVFEGGKIEEVMDVVAKVYDVKIVYVNGAEKTEEKLVGSINTSLTLNQMTTYLTDVFKVIMKIEMDTKRVYVIPRQR